MSRRDSQIDLDQYQPSREELLRAADEDAAQTRLRKALDNPALDAALLELRGPPAESSPLPGAPPAGVPTREAPGAVPPFTAAIRAHEGNRKGARWWPSWAFRAAAAAAILGPLATWVIVKNVPRKHPLEVPAPSASAMIAPVASAPTSASVSTPVAPASATASSPSAEPQPAAAPSVVPSSAPHGPPTKASPKHPPSTEASYVDAGPAPAPAPPPTLAPTVTSSTSPPEPPPLPKFF